MSAHFKAQRQVGEAGERRVLDVFMRSGHGVHWNPSGRRKDLEVRFPHGTELIEVKNEDRFAHSRQACVELYQGLRQKTPSGLKVSEATVIVHLFGDDCLVFRRVEMLLWLEQRIADGSEYVVAFGKSDNGNCGVLLNQMVVAMRPWAEWLPLEQLPQSRVFKPLEQPQ